MGARFDYSPDKGLTIKPPAKAAARPIKPPSIMSELQALNFKLYFVAGRLDRIASLLETIAQRGRL